MRIEHVATENVKSLHNTVAGSLQFIFTMTFIVCSVLGFISEWWHAMLLGAPAFLSMLYCQCSSETEEVTSILMVYENGTLNYNPIGFERLKTLSLRSFTTIIESGGFIVFEGEYPLCEEIYVPKDYREDVKLLIDEIRSDFPDIEYKIYD